MLPFLVFGILRRSIICFANMMFSCEFIILKKKTNYLFRKYDVFFRKYDLQQENDSFRKYGFVDRNISFLTPSPLATGFTKTPRMANTIAGTISHAAERTDEQPCYRETFSLATAH